MRSLVCISCGLALALAQGCAHTQLRWNTVRQSRTLTEIYEQQVLDNLAMFVYDSNSLPFFSFPNAGGSNVNDAGAVTGVLNWAHGVGGLNNGALTLNGSRNITESWTLTPIIDPVKLQLMRCAYQQVVSNCGIGEMSMHCPDCQKMRDAYMGKVTDPRMLACEPPPADEIIGESVPMGRQEPCLAKGAAGEPPATAEIPAESKTATKTTGDAGPSSGTHNTPYFPGSVTTDCLQPRCWIGFGCKKCVPKRCACLKVGHYCGMYVWVMPGTGQDELTKLTLNVLNYAYNDPTPSRTKDVTWEFNHSESCKWCAPDTTKVASGGDAAGGKPADGDAGKITIKATIPFSEPVVPYCPNNTGDGIVAGLAPAKKNVFERSWLQYGSSQPSPIPGAGYLQFQQNQMNLTPQPR